MKISKELMTMAESLPLIRQCMADVKDGKYTTSVMAHIAHGGIVE